VRRKIVAGLREARFIAQTSLVGVALWLSACSALPPPQVSRAQAAETATVQPQSVEPACALGRNGAPAYRKKIAVLAMPPLHGHEAHDLPGIQVEWSRELQRRLHNSERFVVSDASGYQLDHSRDLAEQARVLARHFNVQFVVAGRLTSLAMQKRQRKFGPLEPLHNPFADSRMLQSELEIYDGLTGARIARRQQGETVRGLGVVNPQDVAVEGGFYRTKLGEAIGEMIDGQSAAVAEELACLPFSARIVGADSRGIRIDAGADNNLRVGDQLQLVQYRTVHLAGGGGSEWRDKDYGTLTIREVLPDSAVGLPDGTPQPDWRFGGVARAW